MSGDRSIREIERDLQDVEERVGESGEEYVDMTAEACYLQMMERQERVERGEIEHEPGERSPACRAYARKMRARHLRAEMRDAIGDRDPDDGSAAAAATDDGPDDGGRSTTDQQSDAAASDDGAGGADGQDERDAPEGAS